MVCSTATVWMSGYNMTRKDAAGKLGLRLDTVNRDSRPDNGQQLLHSTGVGIPVILHFLQFKRSAIMKNSLFLYLVTVSMDPLLDFSS